MPIEVKLIDNLRGSTADVMDGALAVRPRKASQSFNATLGTDSTNVQIVPPKSNQKFVITGIILTGTKDISATTDATVTIFEADPSDVDTSVTDLFIVPVARSAQTVLNPLFIDTTEGRYIMGVTTDDDVLVTILGYYV